MGADGVQGSHIDVLAPLGIGVVRRRRTGSIHGLFANETLGRTGVLIRALACQVDMQSPSVIGLVFSCRHKVSDSIATGYVRALLLTFILFVPWL